MPRTRPSNTPNTSNMPLPLALIGGAISGLGSLFGGGYRKQQKLQNQSYQQNLDMWNRQNQYNLPPAQMQRMKDAGLNPALMYGQGTTGNATQMPKHQAPQIDAKVPKIDIPQALGQFQQIKLQEAQTKLLEKQGKSIDAETMFKGLTNILKENEVSELAEYKKYGAVYDGQPVTSSKYSQEARKRHLQNALLSLKEKLAVTEDLEYHTPEAQLRRIKTAQAKLKALGLDNTFKEARNTLAKDGYTFSSNEWASLLIALYEKIEPKIKRRQNPQTQN